MKTSCFDICGTLYFENTTFAFLQYLLRENGRYRCFDAIRKSVIGKVGFKIVDRLFGIDLARKIAVRFLRGEHRSKIEKAATIFVREKLTAIPKIMGILQSSLAQGDRVVLISATLEPVAQAIAAQWSVSVFGSELAYDEYGVSSGNIKLDLLERKAQIVDHLRADAASIVFYSDNFTDAPVQPKVDEFYAVVHNARQEAFWRKRRPTGMIHAR